jgi:hypothetical protein
MKPETVDVVKQVGDGLSFITAVATITNMLPSIAALFTIIWTGMRIAEMITGKEFSVLIGWKKVSKDAQLK